MDDGRALLIRLVDAYNAGDGDAFAACCHPDVSFVPLLTQAGRSPEPYVGHEGMRRYVRDGHAVWGDQPVEVLHAHQVEDVVVASVRLEADLPTGRFSADATYVSRLVDGLVHDMVTFADVGAARRALGTGEDEAAARPPLALALPATPASVRLARHAALAYAVAAGIEDQDAVRLAVTEAATNVVLHAYRDAAEPGPLLLAGRVEAEAVVLSVTDEGGGLLPRPDSPGLGLGIPLMHHHAFEVSFVGAPQRERGTEVRLRFARPAPGA